MRPAAVAFHMWWFGRARPGRGEIEARWPALAGGAEADVLAALAEIRSLQDARDPQHDFLAAEPSLEALVQRGPARVRRAAIDTWATVLEGRVKRAHMDLLADLSSEPDVDPELLGAAIRAALGFDDGGELAAEISRNAQSSARTNQHFK